MKSAASETSRRSPNPFGTLGCCLLLLLVVAAPRVRASVEVYERTLKPLFRERCYSCHGAMQQKARLRVDTVDFLRAGGKSGAALVPGQPDSSLLIQRVATADLDERMPPEHEGQPFSAEQVELLRAWIAGGASGPVGERPEADPREHWSFQPIARPGVPVVESISGGSDLRNPIDAFLARGHRQQGLTPLPSAPRSLLIRRLYLDLIGVPPSLDEQDALERDLRPDWYDRLVDQLLDDPRHGQRWARHWMDIWRYSDPWGLGDQLRNSQKHVWHWRDWIVESLNADVPYDRMVRQMLAADESDPNDLNALRATGFLARNYFLFNRHQWLDETVEHVAKGFLGLTLNCSKCHDHKYDPFPQTDYYRFRAIFEPYEVRTDLVPGVADLQQNGIPRAYDRVPEAPTYRFIRGQETQPDRSVALAPGVPELLGRVAFEVRPVTLPAEAWQPERRPWVIPAYREAAQARLRAAESRRRTLGEAPSGTELDDNARALAMAERVKADRDVVRAQADLDALERRIAWFEVLWSGQPAGVGLREAALRAEQRLAFATREVALSEVEVRWLRADEKGRESVAKERDTAQQKVTEARQALEAPVPADAFVTPLVGAAWTPTRFLDSTRDDPSVAFVSTSTGRRTALARWLTDPGNPLTARVAVNHVWNRHFGAALVPSVFDFGRNGTPPTDRELLDWLASDWVEHGWSFKHLHRRIVTSAAYRRSSSLRGAEAQMARDPDNRWWWRRMPVRLEAQAVRDSLWALAGELDTTPGGPPIPPDAQDSSRRRSLYFLHSNNERNLFLTTFDDALVKECYRRETSIVPQQALALLNSRVVHEAVPRVTAVVAARVGDADEARFVREAFRLLVGFEPGDAEMQAALRSLSVWAAQSPPPPPRRVRENLVWALINHGDFVTLR